MKPLKKVYIATLIVLIAILFAVAYSSWKVKESAIFSAVDSSFGEDAQGRVVFSATIRNDGRTPLEITGYGYNFPGCVPVEDSFSVEPGDSFPVEVFCDSSVTPQDLAGAEFYIQNNVGGSGSSGQSALVFPQFNVATSLGETAGSSGSFSGVSSSGGSGSGSGSSGVTQAVGSGVNTGVTTGQTSNNLEAPALISFASISGPPYITGDTSPTIAFVAPLPVTATASLQSVDCRWSLDDVAFNMMLSSNSCVVSLEESFCYVSSQQEGTGLDFYVACFDGVNQNGANNNLDITGVTIDATAPEVVGSSVSPPDGYLFPSGIDSVILHFVSTEAAICRVSSGANPTTSFNFMPVSCGEGSSHSCTVNLMEPGAIISVNIRCRDGAYNFGGVYSLSYSRGFSVSSAVPTVPAPSSESSSSFADGSGSSSVPDSSESVSNGSGDSAPSVETVVKSTGETVRDFNSQRTIFQWFEDLLKGIFS